MEFDPQDQDIIKLLTKLKDVGGNYPEHMLAARRQSYLTRMAEIEMGLNAGKSVSNAAKNGGTASPAPVASTVLEAVLVVTMIVEASAVAYFYRDKFSNLFETTASQPRVQEVTVPPVVTNSLEMEGVTASPAVTVTLPSVTIEVSASPSIIPVTISSTPIPGVADNNTANGTTSTGANEAKSTAAPNGSNGNEGHHYGQTPKPERTKEPGSNQGSSSDQSLSDQSRPTKAK